jgi:hypothetical protein
MARWKIVNSEKGEELGIKEVSPDSDGFIEVDISKLPKGLSVENTIEFAEKMGIILKVEP